MHAMNTKTVARATFGETEKTSHHLGPDGCDLFQNWQKQNAL